MGRIRASSEWEDREAAVKDRLRSYRDLVRKLQLCNDLVERLYPRVTSVIVSDRVVSLGGNSNEDKIVKKLDLEVRMRASLNEMNREIAAILDLINNLPGEEYVVLFRRYVLNEQMDSISKSSNLSVASCWRAHKRAICRLARKVDSE